MVFFSYVTAKKCQISDASHWLICPAGFIALVKKKKKDSIFLKIFFENELLKDVEIYQKKQIDGLGAL